MGNWRTFTFSEPPSILTISMSMLPLMICRSDSWGSEAGLAFVGGEIADCSFMRIIPPPERRGHATPPYRVEVRQLGLERVDGGQSAGGEFHLPALVLLRVGITEGFGGEIPAEDPLFRRHDPAD